MDVISRADVYLQIVEFMTIMNSVNRLKDKLE